MKFCVHHKHRSYTKTFISHFQTFPFKCIAEVSDIFDDFHRIHLFKARTYGQRKKTPLHMDCSQGWQTPIFFYEPSSFVRTKYGEVANDSMPKPTVSLVNHFKIQTRLLTTNEVDTKVVNPDKIIQRSDHKWVWRPNEYLTSICFSNHTDFLLEKVLNGKVHNTLISSQ